MVNPANLYSEAAAGHMSAAVAGALERVYVPNVKSNDVYVIDPATFKVVDRFKVGVNPQHVVPSWDLHTLWSANNAEGRTRADADRSEDREARARKTRERSVQHVLHAGRRLGDRRRRGPQAARLPQSPDHGAAVFAAHAEVRRHQPRGLRDRRQLCDLHLRVRGGLAKIDTANRKVLGYLKLSKGGMPQDVRVSPDGKLFYVADMLADGVFVINGETFTEIGFIPTGVGAHGLYPSRDGTKLYVTNRGSNKMHGPPHGKGSISVLDFASGRVEATWPIPGGGSPDMGNVSADGKMLWVSGRYDNVVYAIDTATGAVKTIPVGTEPHGLTVWPQPGRYSLGHTGNMR